MNSNYKSSYKAQDKELVSLSVYNVGFEKCDSLHQWGPGIRNHYLIHYVISGKGYYSVNGQTHEINTHDTFIIYPNTEITYYADAKDPWEYAWVGFAGSDSAIILQATDFSKESPFIKNISYGDELVDCIHCIYENHGNGFEHAVRMTSYLYKLLSLFIHEATLKETINPTSLYVQKAIEFISTNYSYPITVEDIAAYVGLSRSHLFRSFESILNTSPKEYLTEFRIKQACYLLEHTDLSITTIANSVGFDNSMYFAKTFKKNRTSTPSEYRIFANKKEESI